MNLRVFPKGFFRGFMVLLLSVVGLLLVGVANATPTTASSSSAQTVHAAPAAIAMPKASTTSPDKATAQKKALAASEASATSHTTRPSTTNKTALHKTTPMSATMSIAAYGRASAYPYMHGPVNAVDPLRYYSRQCVSYVAWWLLHYKHREVYYAGSATNWKAWAYAHHYKVNHTPSVGAVAWWSRGHVAVVIAVSKYYIIVLEFNWTHHFGYDSRKIMLSHGMPTAILHIGG